MAMGRSAWLSQDLPLDIGLCQSLGAREEGAAPFYHIAFFIYPPLLTGPPGKF